MGRGNSCVHGEYEGLYFVDWDNFSDQYEDGEGEIHQSYDFQREEWDEFLDEFISDFTFLFKKFSTCDLWLGREEHAILESGLFYIVTEDNEWSMAIKLVQKEQGYYSQGNIKNLQYQHYQTYLNGMLACLFKQIETVGTYGGAWTHGTLSRGDFNLKISA